MYKVLKPFTNGIEQYRAGQVIGDEIEQVRNFTRLLGGPTRKLPPYVECITGESTDGCFIICKKFHTGGIDLETGSFVDTRGHHWLNETKLLGLNWIRRATESEVRENTSATLEVRDNGDNGLIKPLTKEPAGVGYPPPPLAVDKPLEDKEWLSNEYAHKTMTQIAKDLDCSLATVHRAIKKHGIASRPRGRQKEG